MTKAKERRIVASSLILLGIIFSIIAAFTDCTAGGADNYAHYNIARWAFKYPHLFLDHWGKPVFTILIAPFTQLGFFGARLFNIISGLLTAWLCYVLVSKWEFNKSWLVIVFVIAAPMFFVLMFTGMTEILFGLVLILAIYLFFNSRYILSAIALSFIILVRTEGFIFFPIFALAFLLKRKFKAIPFMLTGFLIFSVIGKLYHFNDFFWLITKMPYGSSSKEIYGSGNLFHFLRKMPEYLGFGTILIFVSGTFFWIKDWVNSKFNFQSNTFYQLLILGGCFFGYLAAHSFVWWKGEMSLGLVRVMAGVSPAAGIIALAGYNRFEQLIPTAKIKYVFLVIAITVIVVPGTLRYKSEFNSDPHSVLIKKAIEWLNSTKNNNHKLVIHDPSIAFFAGIDAWDQQVVQYGFSDINSPEKGLADSTIFIWDSHFSHNEGRISSSQILENPKFELISYFEPEHAFQVLGGNNYYIMLFRKIEKKNVDNYKTLDEFKNSFGKQLHLFGDFVDFETSRPELVNDKFRISETDSVINFYYQMGEGIEFSPCYQYDGKQFEISNRLGIEINFDFKTKDSLLQNEVMMVFSVEKENKSYNYQTADLLPFLKSEIDWNKAKYFFDMPPDVKKGSQIKLYIWDVARKEIRIDNYSIKIYSKE